jgi:hypothetical protein
MAARDYPKNLILDTLELLDRSLIDFWLPDGAVKLKNQTD